MNTLLTSAIWLIRQFLAITPTQWGLVLKTVQGLNEAVAGTLQGQSKRASAMEALKRVITSESVRSLFIELAVQFVKASK